MKCTFFSIFVYCSSATSISPCEHAKVYQIFLSFVPRWRGLPSFYVILFSMIYVVTEIRPYPSSLTCFVIVDICAVVAAPVIIVRISITTSPVITLSGRQAHLLFLLLLFAELLSVIVYYDYFYLFIQLFSADRLVQQRVSYDNNNYLINIIYKISINDIF